MKLKHVFGTAVVALAITACTNNDMDKDMEIRTKQMSATISLAAQSNTQTRATDQEAQANESKIERLSVLIFNEAGARVAFQEETDATILADKPQVKNIPLKVNVKEGKEYSEDKFSAVIIANATDKVKEITTLKEAQSMIITERVDTYKPGTSALPMTSKVIQFTGVHPDAAEGAAKTENWIPVENGDVTEAAEKIPVDRLVARVQVESLKVEFAEASHSGGSFQLTHLAVINGRSNSSAYNANNADFSYLKGYESKEIADGGWIAPSEVVSSLGKAYSDIAPIKHKDSKTWADKDDSKFMAYTFANPKKVDENPNIYQSALLIAGLFRLNANDTNGTLKHYRVYLNENGAIEVKPNHVYKINVTITGAGSDTEEEIQLNAHVNATVTVKPWTVIEQEERPN